MLLRRLDHVKSTFISDRPSRGDEDRGYVGKSVSRDKNDHIVFYKRTVLFEGNYLWTSYEVR